VTDAFPFSLRLSTGEIMAEETTTSEGAVIDAGTVATAGTQVDATTSTVAGQGDEASGGAFVEGDVDTTVDFEPLLTEDQEREYLAAASRRYARFTGGTLASCASTLRANPDAMDEFVLSIDTEQADQFSQLQAHLRAAAAAINARRAAEFGGNHTGGCCDECGDVEAASEVEGASDGAATAEGKAGKPAAKRATRKVK
jgi:hypothetical protein